MRRVHNGQVVQFTCTKWRWEIMLMNAAGAHLECHPNICLEKIAGSYRQKMDLRPHECKAEMLNNYASKFNRTG